MPYHSKKTGLFYSQRQQCFSADFLAWGAERKNAIYWLSYLYRSALSARTRKGAKKAGNTCFTLKRQPLDRLERGIEENTP